MATLTAEELDVLGSAPHLLWDDDKKSSVQGARGALVLELTSRGYLMQTSRGWLNRRPLGGEWSHAGWGDSYSLTDAGRAALT